jgi:pyruvate-ferredoxin/flavodoxin oxidoreductase
MKVMKSMDGNMAAAYVAYAFTEVAAIYPITPSSPMGEYVDEWAAHGKKNMFGNTVSVSELQSEGGASGAVHGSLAAGSLTTTFTASQGLLLMIPNMYKISGELLPGVFHVSARALAAHALSIFGDHSDVMAVRQTGFGMIASGSIQEIIDLAGVAHLSAIKSRVPFLHFFDGFRSSHEIQKVELIDYKDFRKLLDEKALEEFRARALSPEHPVTRGTAQNPDIFFQARESSNIFYEKVPKIVEEYMDKVSKLTGREYKPFNYVGAKDAEYVIVAMGSVTDTIDETVNYLNKIGEKVGVIKVHLYRPFSAEFFLESMPKTVKKIAVMDRTKEPGALGEPLYTDIKTMFFEIENRPVIIGGRYGLGSKDTTPGQIKAVFDNLKSDNPKNGFTVGIIDDVTYKSLEVKEEIGTTPEGTIRCKFWGLGGDGTVGANKDAIKIIGDNTDLYAQGYFAYDSRKSGGLTISHLRFGKSPIKSTYLITDADFVACHNQAYVNKYDLLKGLKKGGTFVLNCKWSEEELDERLPANIKRYLSQNNINFYIIDATGIAAEIGLGSRINMIMQTAFFKLSKVIPIDDAVKYMKEAIKKTYGRKGEKIVNMNYQAVDKGIKSLKKVSIPDSWKDAVEEKDIKEAQEPDFIKNILRVMNRQEGDNIPVSAFIGSEDGSFPHGTSAYEKRGDAVNVAEWQKENCIQCNECAFVCPHAAIRPVLLTEKELKNSPADFETLKARGKGMENYAYSIQVSPLDCTGCGSCVEVCPVKEKALIMKPIDTQMQKAKSWDFASKIPVKEDVANVNTVIGSQFRKPLLEFSGACPGCAETTYAKLVTQLFGDRMLIANATGCSSIWGGSAPSIPYTVNDKGKGPAWANSLFEDNAEYAYGMLLAINYIRNMIENYMKQLAQLNIDSEIKKAVSEWIEGKNDVDVNKESTEKILELFKKDLGNKEANEIRDRILKFRDYLIKKSVWAFGGDGWAYDIGYGGLDHVLASGEDISVLVFDTEVYSNTGGQSSKSTPMGAVAKFAASGRKVKKKDLGLMAINYGYVYVSQIAMGASHKQTLRAFLEAEKYSGPSLIIAYCPCIEHGIYAGMENVQLRQKQAVNSGYWHLYRYNPELKKAGENPFILDSKEPKESFREFLMGEVRYASLVRTFPDIAEELFSQAEKDAREKYEKYKKMAETK